MRRSPGAWECRASATSSRTFRSAYSIRKLIGAISTKLNALREKSGPMVDTIRNDLTARLAKHGIEAEILGRMKSPYSIFSKMQRKSIGFEQLSDVFGFRVLVATEEDCYRALGVVHTAWPMVPGRFKDYVSTPKQNEYRSLHTTIIGPRRQRVELQIRTRAMDQIAEYGIAAHPLYKDGIADDRRPAGGRKPRLCVAAADGRTDRPWRCAGGFPRAHQARALPGSGFLLHAEGPADRAAARRDPDRLRLRGPHRRRRHLHRSESQRPAFAARAAAGERRRGGHHQVRRAAAARRLGGDRGDRQGALRHPAGEPQPGAAAICGAWPPYAGATFRAGGESHSARMRCCATACRLNFPEVDDLLAAVGRGEVSADAVLEAGAP